MLMLRRWIFLLCVVTVFSLSFACGGGGGGGGDDDDDGGPPVDDDFDDI